VVRDENGRIVVSIPHWFSLNAKSWPLVEKKQKSFHPTLVLAQRPARPPICRT